MKLLSSEFVLYLYKSAIHPSMEYCCQVWAGAPNCYLELLNKLQKRICRTVGPSLSASLEPLAHRQNVASLSLFYRYYFGRCSSELAQLVSLFLVGGLLVILIDCMIFLSLFLEVTRMDCRAVSQLATSPTDTSPRTNPRPTHPQRTITQLDTSLKDTFLTGHFPTKTFPRTDISPTITYFQISAFFSETFC